jgi:hypothetical protein
VVTICLSPSGGFLGAACAVFFGTSVTCFGILSIEKQDSHTSIHWHTDTEKKLMKEYSAQHGEQDVLKLLEGYRKELASV